MMQTEVLCGDCLKLLPQVPQVNLIFADPPFNIGHPYLGYDDNKTDVEYRLWTHKWVARMYLHLQPNGIIVLHGHDALAELYLEAARKFHMRRIAWVNWHYRFGQCNSDNWIDSRCHCLIFTNARPPNKYTWNPDEVRVDSDRKAVYADQRIDDYERGGSRLPFTVWGIPSDGPFWGRIQGNNKERQRGQPNQLPEVYLERLIRAYTNPGDFILDPFGGSGTTAVVANTLGRNCTTFDVDPEACKTIAARILAGAVRVKEKTDEGTDP